MYLESRLHKIIRRVPHIHFHGNRTEKKIALTFDDSPTTQTNYLLRLLTDYKIKATFFVVGDKAREQPEALQQIMEQGSEIGNHSYSHKQLLFQSKNDIASEIIKTEQVLEENGVQTRLFRPPYGNIGLNTYKVAKQAGYDIIMADVDPRDWKQDNYKRIENHIKEYTTNGSIICLHDGINGSKENYEMKVLLR